jgi:erythromycin esterase
VTDRRGTGVFVPAAEVDASAGIPVPIRLGAVDAGVTIRGRVTLAGERRPEPFLVALGRSSDDEGDIFMAPVAADGRFSAVVPAGTYFLRVQSAECLSTHARVSGERGDVAIAELQASLLTPAPDDTVAWLADNAIALGSSDVDAPTDDLAPLVTALAGARIIGVGEATHGTAEFFRLKHRLFERLVAEHGVTVLAMEANVVDAELVDDYVRAGKGTADEAVKHLFLVWQTEEVRDLLAWMRAYNADPKHRRKLRFVGYDVQDAAAPIARLRRYLRKVDPPSETLLEPLAPLEARPIELTPEDEATTRAAAARLVEALVANEKKLRARSGARAYATHLQYARTIVQAQAREAADDPGAQFTERDRGMAANVAWIVDQSRADERMMVWAHNGHIRVDSEGLLGRNMGTELRERFGDDYVTIGFVPHRGEYRAARDRQHPRDTVLVPIDASAPGFLAEAFARVGLPIFAVDLRRVPAGAVRDWLAAPHLVHSCGWLVSEAERMGTVGSITKRFDLVIFVDQTTGATPLASSRGASRRSRRG